MIDFENLVNTEITSGKINFKSWSICPIQQCRKHISMVCSNRHYHIETEKVIINLENLIGNDNGPLPPTVTTLICTYAPL